MLTKKQRNHYKREGFLIIPNLNMFELLDSIMKDAYLIFSFQIYSLLNEEEQSGSIKSGMFELFKQHPEVFKNCGKAIQHLPRIHYLGIHPIFIQILKELGLKNPAISTRPVVFFHNKELAEESIYYKVPAHQDYASIRGSLNGCVVWLPLTKINEDMGFLEIVPRSHLKGNQATKYVNSFGLVNKYKDEEFVPIRMKLGDVVFFNMGLVHRSGNNITEKIRWSANYRFNDFSDPSWIKRGYYTPYTYKSDPSNDPNLDFPTEQDIKDSGYFNES